MTAPWGNEPGSVPDNEQSRHRESAGGFHRHPDSVSGSLRISDMVAPRKIPPGSGWRKFVYLATFKTVNFGESPAERHYRELRERIRRHIRKQYVVGVISGKGGVGKTTMTASIGAVFRECRPENVVAIDAAPGFGTLAGRIDETPPGDYSAVLNDTDVQGYADIREHLGQNAVGLDVLAGNRASDQPRPLVPSMFTGVLSRLRRTHNVMLVDTADDLEHPVMKAVFDACDTLVFVSGLTADTSLPVTRAIDLLRSLGYHELVSRSMVILNDSRNKYDADARKYLVERFSQSGATVEFMPYDPHLAKGGIIDVQHELNKETRLRLFEITAAIADKYTPDADRPR
ncbi:MinD/ParA family ATP-binding protein [[Mycobacterium] burgundiense]|uniref:MinD/ParA family protein n=1 Tax=[Mycobacterium] burgundiense TaxID=3064286 RepID=A0ABM9L879_9MYCO|nr:MinD/ParA family protein [Mycolicibacterium sp. MU0053]CAJ1494508.1 MinD/ParA family protein [Mycolicibacterium sp. MU0053]